jgi:hypothetical protein
MIYFETLLKFAGTASLVPTGDNQSYCQVSENTAWLRTGRLTILGMLRREGWNGVQRENYQLDYKCGHVLPKPCRMQDLVLTGTSAASAAILGP